MDLSTIRNLYAYDAWATNRTLEAVAALSDEQYRKEIGSSHGGVHGTFVHLHGADRIWMDRIKGLPAPRMTKAEEVKDLADLRSRIVDYQREMDAFLSEMTDERLKQSFEYKDMKGNAHSGVLGDILQHKVNHATYHRGQITALIRIVGGKPIGTDMVTWQRLKAEGRKQ